MPPSPPDATATLAEAIGGNGNGRVETEPRLTVELPGLPPEIAEACDRLAETLTPEERPDYPQTGVREHLDSLHGLVGSMHDEGEISQPVERVLRVFIETHDYGYCIDPEFYASYPAEHIGALQAAAHAGGLGYREGTERAIALYEYLVHHGEDPMFGKVLAHGVNSMPHAVRELTEAGLTEEQATGTALIFASHHPGFPINFVADKLLQAELPAEFRPLLLIDDGQGGDPNRFRRGVVDRAAKLAGIPRHDARILAALGYGIDRITPMRPPDDVIYATDGELKIIGGEFVQKKLALIIPGILKKGKPEDCTYESMLETALEFVEQEAAEAVVSARTLQVPEMVPVLERTTARELQRAREAHNELVFVLRELVGRGLSGNFGGINEDIGRLRMIGRNAGERLLLSALESVADRVTALSPKGSPKE